MKRKNAAIALAILAAALYAVNSPISKLLLQQVSPAMLLGFVAYGLSIHCYILAQKDLGAAKTSAFYSVAPFLGVAFSVLLGERPGLQFYAALLIMAGATVLLVRDTIALQHTHEHRHGDVIHTHEHEHIHTHLHVHGEDTALHNHSHGELDGHDHCHSFA